MTGEVSAGHGADYGADLAHIHHTGHSSLAQAAAVHLLGLLAERGIARGTVVDLGCGGGALLKAVAEKGYTARGIDASAALVGIAQASVPQAEFEVASVYDAALPRSVAMISSGEVFNYIPPGAEEAPPLGPFFARVSDVLEPGGLFLFDVIVQGETLLDASGFREGADWVVLSTNTEDRAAGTLTRRIATFREVEPGLYRRTGETHRVRVLAADRVTADLEAAGFAVSTFEAYADEPLLPRRKGFLAEKAG